MEWTNKEAQASTPAPAAAPSPAPSPTSHTSKKKGRLSGGGFWSKLTKISFIVLLFSGTILVVALLWYLVLGDKNNESKYVDTSKMQAVFLNGGQVYFGNISSLNDSYARLNNIYYLRVNQQVQPGQTTSSNDVSLVKLGCELHGPIDEMLINRDQIVFWENLKTDGQVAKAVAEYVKQNPDGQKCNTTSNGNSSGNSNTNNTNTNTNTNTTNNNNR